MYSYLRWHLPLGILLDLYRVETDLWMITCHFSDFPHSEIEPLDQSAVESSFRMAVKEADQIRTRSERTNQFQTADYKRLWASVREASLAEWKQVATRLFSGQSEDRLIPVKFHYDCCYFQTPVENSDDETLSSALKRALPQSHILQKFKVLYFGAELEMETPLKSLKNLTYGDTFVHLVLQSAH